MSTINLIIPPCTAYRTSDQGYAGAGDAYVAAGLPDDLAALGVPVAGVSRPVLAESEQTGDSPVDTGRYGALVADAVAGAIGRAELPLLAGGTCNHLVGMLAGLQRAYGPTALIGLVWLDAHGDFNTPRTSYSQMQGGMPVACAAGLCFPEWREAAGQTVVLPTDRIVMVDVRNLDDREEVLLRATEATVAEFGEGFDPAPVIAAVRDLAERVDHIYLHIDSDILDERFQPNHGTKEPNGPDLPPVVAIIDAAVETGKVRAGAVVSVDPAGEAGTTSLASGLAMLRAIGAGWARESMLWAGTGTR